MGSAGDQLPADPVFGVGYVSELECGASGKRRAAPTGDYAALDAVSRAHV